MADLPSSIGVLGVGTIASATIRGLCRGSPVQSVVLSPRNAKKAQELRDEFPEVIRVANSNQEVVDSCGCILVAVLPAQAGPVLLQLSFRPEQQVVSLMAGVYPKQLRELCGNLSISVVIPYPSIAQREGAALLLRPSPAALAIFESLGRCVAVEDEENFRYLACASGLMGNFYKQQLTVQRWLESHGVDANISAAWTGASFAAFAADSADAEEDTFQRLLHEQTPGGLNEKVWQLMDDDGNNDALRFALSSVHHRLCHGRFDPQLAPAQGRMAASAAGPWAALLAAVLRWLRNGGAVGRP